MTGSLLLLGLVALVAISVWQGIPGRVRALLAWQRAVDQTTGARRGLVLGLPRVSGSWSDELRIMTPSRWTVATDDQLRTIATAIGRNVNRRASYGGRHRVGRIYYDTWELSR